MDVLFVMNLKVKNLLNFFLIDNNIIFETQKKFNDCRNIYCLPFDFYLPIQNILIEFDGEQHFKPIRFNGIANEIALKKYLITKRNDEIKNQYCLDNNIKLIRISYKENNIVELLNNLF